MSFEEDNFRFAKNNRSKLIARLIQHKRFNNQAVWPVIFGITGPICARVSNLQIQLDLFERGHHDWPVMRVIQDLSTSS